MWGLRLLGESLWERGGNIREGFLVWGVGFEIVGESL